MRSYLSTVHTLDYLAIQPQTTEFIPYSTELMKFHFQTSSSEDI